MTPEGVTFALGDCPDAEIRIEGLYETVAELARIVVASDPVAQKELDDRARTARRAGLLTIRHALGFQPAFMAQVHDIMARITA